MKCLTMISRYSFASGADEKVRMSTSFYPYPCIWSGHDFLSRKETLDEYLLFLFCVQVIRVFEAPRSFVNVFAFLSQISDKNVRIFQMWFSWDVKNSESFKTISFLQISDYKALGASVPVLGLSNKAVFNGKLTWTLPSESALSLFLQTFLWWTDDLENLKDDLKDPQRPMKASAFASEEPAPFSPFIPKGKLSSS
jgi:hypothetical protein